MFSEEEKLGFLEDAQSLERRKDFDRMRENVLSRRWTPEEHASFLTAMIRHFGNQIRHPIPVDNGKFLI